MVIDWRPDNRPDAAERIASHTQRIIAAMNEATSVGQVKGIFDDWWRFARDNRVCQQICDHMIDKRRVLVGEFEKPRTRQTSDLSKRMTGDDRE